MRTVTMTRDFDFHVSEQQTISFLAGQTYERVPEAQVEAIVKAKAGHVVKGERDAPKK